LGGGQQSEDTLPDGHANDTNPLTEAEMMNNRPTPNRLGAARSRPAQPLTSELAHGEAKGTRLLGVRAVIARGFERIHRSNLIGMGVLPCQFPEGVSAQTLGLDGTERFDLVMGASVRPRQPVVLKIERRDGRQDSVSLVLRLDTPIEAAYFSAGGILPYVLDQLLAQGGHEEATR
jgi:hypothetical protein